MSDCNVESNGYSNIGKLLADAKTREAESIKSTKEKARGLEFMAQKLDVAEKHLELAVKKIITPAEDNVLKVLQLGTLGARNSKRSICSKAEFFIEDISKRMGYREPAKIWRLLKSLERKKIIIREKTRSKGREIIGLNPLIFGQILIDKQHETEKRRHLHLVPNQDDSNPESGLGQRTMCSPSTNDSFVGEEQNVRNERTIRSFSDAQDNEIVEENIALDSFRSNINSSKWGKRNQELHSISNGKGIKASAQLKDPAAEMKRQIEEAKAAGIL